MAIRNIVKTGDDVLTKMCRPVEKFDAKLWALLDDMNDTRKVVGKIHGNSLSSNKINYGYQLIDKNNNIVKYGESKNPLTRYSSKWLDEHGYRVQIKIAGTKRGVHEW